MLSEGEKTGGTAPRVLIAGIGNIFMGDDAFGVEVAQKLSTSVFGPEVMLRDFGIRGLDLTYALLDGWDTVILIDAAPRGQPPGTLYVIEPRQFDFTPVEPGSVMIETHGMDPEKVLRVVASMGGRINRLLLVGCEPGKLGSDEDMQMGLSPAVAAAVPEAVKLVETLVAQILAEEPATGMEKTGAMTPIEMGGSCHE